MSPEEWAERFLSAVLPFYAPVVAYSVSIIMLMLCVWLLRNGAKQSRALRAMSEAQATAGRAMTALSDRYDELNARLQVSIDEHATHRARSEAQFATLIEVQERFFASPAMSSAPSPVVIAPEVVCDAGVSIAPRDGSER